MSPFCLIRSKNSSHGSEMLLKKCLVLHRRKSMNVAIIIFYLITMAWKVRANCDINTPYPTKEHELRDKILCNYDRNIRPVKSPNNKTNVTSYFYLRHVDFDETTNILYAYMTLSLEWKDEFLTWDLSEYNVSAMNIPSDKLWMPDLTNYRNWMAGSGVIPLEHQPIYLTSNGIARYFNNVEMPAHCAVNLAHWPYDKHECTLYLSSRNHYSDTLEFLVHEGWSFELLGEYYHNNIWDISALKSKVAERYYGANNTYRLASIVLTIEIKRHSSTLFSTVTSPITVLALMMLSTFWINPCEMYRMIFLLMSAIGHLAYLQYLGIMIPPNGSQSIAIVTFLRNSLVLNWLAFLVHLWNKRLTRSEQPSPEWLTNLASWVQASDIAKYLCLTDDLRGLKIDDEVNLVAERVKNLEWIVLVTLIDRMCFIIYLISYILMLIIFII